MRILPFSYSTTSLIFPAILSITETHTLFPACLYKRDSLILVGNLKLIKDVDINLNKDIINISEEFTKKGCTVIYLSIDNKLIGYVALSDILREEAKEVISYIKSQKINPVMLTGDNKNS